MGILKESIHQTIRSVLTDDQKAGMFDGCLISEASLGRVLQHYQDGRFFIITANRKSMGNRFSSANRQANAKLLSELNARKLGPQTLIGHWQECQDDSIDYKDCPVDLLVDVEEYSFFVAIPEDMSDVEAKSLVAGLTRKYNQDASIWRDEKGLFLIGRSGSLDKIGSGTMTINKIAQAYSKIARGDGKPKKNKDGSPRINVDDMRPFVFEGILVPATNHGKALFEAKGITYPRLSDLELMTCPTVAERFGRQV